VNHALWASPHPSTRNPKIKAEVDQKKANSCQPNNRLSLKFAKFFLVTILLKKNPPCLPHSRQGGFFLIAVLRIDDMSRIVVVKNMGSYNWCIDFDEDTGEVFQIPKPRPVKHIPRRLYRMRIYDYLKPNQKKHHKLFRQIEPYARLNTDGFKSLLSIFGI